MFLEYTCTTRITLQLVSRHHCVNKKTFLTPKRSLGTEWYHAMRVYHDMRVFITSLECCLHSKESFSPTVTHLSLDEMAAISQTTFSDAFSWMKSVCILIEVSLKFVSNNGSIDNNPKMVRIMAWRQTGDKTLSEPMLVHFTDAFMRHKGEMS